MGNITGNDGSGGKHDERSFMRPWLAKAEFWKQCREHRSRVEIDPRTEFESRAMVTSKTSNEEKNKSRFRFLDLPVEIRRQVYYWLHVMSPVCHAQLAPWYPIPVYSHYIVSPITERSLNAPERNAMEEATCPPRHPSPEEQKELDEMLSPFRPLSALPSSLLRVNSKIYFEARDMPFEHNEFVFVNWFASGLWAAKAFTDKLSAWQRERMRHVRLEMIYRDFTKKGYEAWVSLCDAWAPSVRGMRLKIIFTSCLFADKGPDSKGPGEGEDRAAQLRKWIGPGLKKLVNLERLELEMMTEDMDNAMKVEACRGLEEMLREEGMNTVVVATKKVRYWTRHIGAGEILPVSY